MDNCTAMMADMLTAASRSNNNLTPHEMRRSVVVTVPQLLTAFSRSARYRLVALTTSCTASKARGVSRLSLRAASAFCWAALRASRRSNSSACTSKYAIRATDMRTDSLQYCCSEPAVRNMCLHTCSMPLNPLLTPCISLHQLCRCSTCIAKHAAISIWRACSNTHDRGSVLLSASCACTQSKLAHSRLETWAA